MALEVRPIAAEELADWVGVLHLAFHNKNSVDDEVVWRREVHQQDLTRSLAAVEDGRLVGTYQSFTTELSLPGETACVSANAVTAVAVMPTYHRRGALTRMLRSDMQTARERGEAASVLIAAEYPIYGRFGFGPATQQATYQLQTVYARFLRQPVGHVELVKPTQLSEVVPGMFDAFRRRYPGQIGRRQASWAGRLGVRPPPWRPPEERPLCALYSNADGQPTGYLLYHVTNDWEHHLPTSALEVDELVALEPDAYLGLWRYCAEIDLLKEVNAHLRNVDEPLPWLLADPRKALQELSRTDFMWLRTLDTPRVLAERRYLVEDRLIFEVDDPLGIAGGRFALESGSDGATCRPSQQSAQVRMSMTALGALVLGGSDPRGLATAGLIEESATGALERAARLFSWHVTPWCSTFF
jgi:predicted acetyltransferase